MLTSVIKTPLGYMRAVSDEFHLYGLRFCDAQTSQELICSKLIYRLQQELDAYFQGSLQQFSIPYQFNSGTAFQNKVWQALGLIGYGVTYSYQHIANLIGQPRSVRAVATAISNNPLHLIVPCHRVIRADGTLGGYRGGVDKKQWLLAQERC